MDLSILTKPLTKPPMMTLVGTPGVGKTTLAALFPKAVFITAEDGTAVFDSWEDDLKPMVFPKLPRAKMGKTELEISTIDTLLQQLRVLIKEDHEYKTLVIDSVTSLHTLFEHELCEIYGVDNVAEAAGGFAKGFKVLKEMHAKVKNACDHLREKGMTVIFLAHTGTKKVKNSPDVSSEYTVFSLDMDEQSVQIYVNLCDAVLYIRQEEIVSGAVVDKKGNTTKFGKMVQTGERWLVTASDGRKGFVLAKNRYKLDANIALPEGENPLLTLIPFFNKGN